MTAPRLMQVLLLALLGLAGGAQAQFKVVGPDGRITYTDRPQAEPGSQVQPLRRDGSAAGAATVLPAAVPLPLELRPLVARFPVTLYTSADCPPCDSGRALLQQRGVPFSERTVASNDDIAALQRLTAGRTVPSLTVGGQALRGFQDADWQEMLGLAGYPTASRLPRGHVGLLPAPLVARVVPAPAAGVAAPDEPTPASAAPAASGGIRF